jgi:hypothetical protein
MVEIVRELSNEGREAILTEIKEKSAQLIYEQDLPIHYFRLAHQSCLRREEPAGMLGNMLDHYVMQVDWAYREVCLIHNVSSMKFAKP